MPSMARGLTSDGAITWVKPASRAWSIAMLISANSSCGADAGEEVEARARHLGAALEVDGAEHPAELDVVARLEVELEARGVPTVSRTTKSSSPPAGASSAARLGMSISAARHTSSASVCAASAALTSAASSLVRAEQLGLLLALRLRDQLAELLLLGPLGLEVDDRRAPGRVGGERPVDHVVGQAALGLGGAHAVGVVTEQCAGRSWRQGYPSRVGSLTRVVRGSGERPAPVSCRHLPRRHSGRHCAASRRNRVLDRPRLDHPELGPALLRAVRGRRRGWSPTTGRRVDPLDDRGDPAEHWAVDEGWLRQVLQVRRAGVRHLGMIVLTVAAGRRCCCKNTAARRSSRSS